MQNLAALRKLIVNGKWLIVIFLFSIFLGIPALPESASSAYSLFTSAAYAAEPPNPLPCQNAIWEPAVITDNWLVDENRNPPANLQGDVGAVGPSGASVTVTKEFYLTVDFSKLGAIFGPTNSNYLEGKFQSQEHKTVDVVGLDPTSFSTYHGSEEKAAPRAMLDQLRVKTVKYIYEHPNLGESGDMFTDVNGQNPMTIYDLYQAYRMPDPDTQRGTDAWDNGWGKYWAKIPTAYSEFYEARIVFREESNNHWIQKVLNKDYCPGWLPRQITFVMPEFFRTTATSGQLNQVIVPGAAQSDHSNDLILQNGSNSISQSKNILGKFIDACLKVFENNPLSNSLKKVISFSIQLLSPIKNAYAQDNQNDCIRILATGKEGQDPYCALPAGQLQSGDSCSSQTDEFKLDRDNQNVVCTFKIVWEKEMVLSEGDGENQFDSCTPIPFTDRVACSVKVFVWPIFKIPWLTEIWNNTLYSDTEENEPGIGSKDWQEEGRPGVYSFFTPKAVFEDETEKLKNRLTDLVENCRSEQREQERQGNPIDPTDSSTWGDACMELVDFAMSVDPSQYSGFNNCLTGRQGVGNPLDIRVVIRCADTFVVSLIKHLEKKLPGESDLDSEDDLKRRFIGGTDCSKEFVWHNALYPLAAQKYYGITNACPVQAAAQPPGGIPPGPIPPPGGTNTLDYYIRYGDTSFGVSPQTRQELEDLANNGPWRDNNLDQWDFVVSQSIARGISPAFTIAIWMEEGGFGGAGAIDQFGMVRCPQHDLESSLNCFLDFTAGEYPYNRDNPYDSFYNWVNYFCGPNREYICGPSLTDPSDTNENFIGNLEWAITTVNPDAIEHVGSI